MAIHDDNWTKEFAAVDMSPKDRAFYVVTGLAILFVLSAPFIPAGAWDYIAPPLTVGVAGLGLSLAGWFILKGVRGRW